MKFINRFGFLIGALCVSSCSTPVSQPTPSLDSSRAMPSSFQRLEQFREKSGIEYEVAAYQAATDVIRLGKSYLEDKNSGRAFELLSLGTQLLPWRSDVIQLRHVALTAFLAVTEDMIRDPRIPCSTIDERIRILQTTSPDSIVALDRSRQTRCPILVSHSLPSSDAILLQLKSPLPSPDLAREERHFSKLTEAIANADSYRQRLFDARLLLMSSFGPLMAWFRDLAVTCDHWQILPSESASEMAYYTAHCRMEGTVSRAGASLQDHCDRVRDLVAVTGGPEVILCNREAIPTSMPMASRFQESFDNGRDWGISSNRIDAVMVPSHWMIRATVKGSLGERDAYYLFPSNSPFFYFATDTRPDYFLRIHDKLNIFPRMHVSEMSSAIGLVEGKESEMIMGPFGKDEIQGLDSITYRIDFQKTYDFVSLLMANMDECRWDTPRETPSPCLHMAMKLMRIDSQASLEQLDRLCHDLNAEACQEKENLMKRIQIAGKMSVDYDESDWNGINSPVGPGEMARLLAR